MKRKHDPAMIVALKTAGKSNRAIGRELGINEASVRRALKEAMPKTRRRVTVIVFEECV